MPPARTGRPEWLLRILGRAHRLCLRAYPSWFRDAHSDAMVGTFEDLMLATRAQGGSWKAVRVAFSEYMSLVSRGLTERWIRRDGELYGPEPHEPSAGHRSRQTTINARERNRMFVFKNLRYAARSVARTPGYTVAFVLTLGLGIGANTAIFSVINGVLLQPLPYPDADRIMYVQQPAVLAGFNNTSMSFVEVADYRAQSSTIDEFVEFGDWTFNVLERGDPHLATGGLVTANFFKVLGLRPHLGRTLVLEDGNRSAEPVAVLTHEYWTRVFGADSSVIGQILDLTVKKAAVVGVLEPGSHYATIVRRQDFYVNYAANDHYMGAAMQDERTHRMTSVFGHLAPTATVQQAQIEISEIAARLHAEYSEAYPESSGYETIVTPWLEELTKDARPTLWLLLATAGFVLIIACANVANLTLTRLVRRERELAIRAALGAAKSRLRGQLLSENLLLSLGGAGLGLVLAVAGLDVLVAYTARYTTRTGEINVDGFVLLFTLAVAVGAALLFAWAPGLPFSRDLGVSLTAAGGGRATGSVSRRRAQRALVVSQLAVSFMLLVGAGLLVRSLVRLSQVDPGFDLENVLTMRAPDFSQRSQTQRRQFEEALMDRVGQHPAVHAAAMASQAPLAPSFPRQQEFRIEGRMLEPHEATSLSVVRTVSADYFETIGIPLLRGRAFSRADHADGVTVAIISASMAEYYFADQDPIGRRIASVFSNGNLSPWRTIVGIAADSKSDGLDRDVVNTLYRASIQTFSPSTVIVRATGDPQQVVPLVLNTVRELDPNRPVDNIATLEELRADHLAPQRLNATLFGTFALLALVIATVGVAGVLAFSVSQRTHEFGIRVTLGADQQRVLNMVLREGATLAAAGLAIGGAGALLLSRFMSGLLFEVQPIDPPTFVGVAALLIFVASAAAYVPARRATRVDPMEALRSD